MANQKGQNQTSARNTNLALIMEEFERRSMSRTDMSRIFHLSKPATSKIAAELESLGLICPSEDRVVHNLPGVKPVNYEINPNLGLIGIIDLSTVEANISICDFAGKALDRISLPDLETIDYNAFLRIRKILKDLLASRSLRSLPLLSLCVAIPCAVNKNTKEIQWSPRFNVANSFDIFRFFSEEFNVQVIIKNDVQLLLFAEQERGLINSNIKYALLVYVDAGLGGSFYFDSHLEEGENGTAGDIGFYNVNDNGQIIPLDSAASINAIKRKLKEHIENNASSCLPAKIRYKDIVAAYKDNDPLTVKVINETAAILANALVNFINIFDVGFIIINGRITQLGSGYIHIIMEIIAKNFPKVKVGYSKIESAARTGAYIAARNEIIKDKISRRNIK